MFTKGLNSIQICLFIYFLRNSSVITVLVKVIVIRILIWIHGKWSCYHTTLVWLQFSPKRSLLSYKTTDFYVEFRLECSVSNALKSDSVRRVFRHRKSNISKCSAMKIDGFHNSMSTLCNNQMWVRYGMDGRNQAVWLV